MPMSGFGRSAVGEADGLEHGSGGRAVRTLDEQALRRLAVCLRIAPADCSFADRLSARAAFGWRSITYIGPDVLFDNRIMFESELLMFMDRPRFTAATAGSEACRSGSCSERLSPEPGTQARRSATMASERSADAHDASDALETLRQELDEIDDELRRPAGAPAGRGRSGSRTCKSRTDAPLRDVLREARQIARLAERARALRSRRAVRRPDLPRDRRFLGPDAGAAPRRRASPATIRRGRSRSSSRARRARSATSPGRRFFGPRACARDVPRPADLPRRCSRTCARARPTTRCCRSRTRRQDRCTTRTTRCRTPIWRSSARKCCASSCASSASPTCRSTSLRQIYSHPQAIFAVHGVSRVAAAGAPSSRSSTRR